MMGCRVTSKVAGIGEAERSWAAVKDVKTPKRASLQIDSLEKQTAIASAANVEKQRMFLENDVQKKHKWDQEDEVCDLGFDAWGSTAPKKKAAMTTPKRGVQRMDRRMGTR